MQKKKWPCRTRDHHFVLQNCAKCITQRKPHRQGTNCSEIEEVLRSHVQPGVVYLIVAGVHSFHRRKGNELFPAHRQRAAGSCQTEVAACIRWPGVDIKEVFASRCWTGLKTAQDAHRKENELWDPTRTEQCLYTQNMHRAQLNSHH